MSETHSVCNSGLVIMPGYYVSTVAGGGCLLCGCDVAGTIGGTTCDPQTGQCVCRGDGSGVGGLKCNSCLGNYHSFDPGTGRWVL